MPRRFCLLSIFLLALAGCAERTVMPPPGPLPLERLAADRIPSFFDDMAFDGLGQAIDRSLDYLARVDPDRPFIFGEDRYSAAHMIRSLSRFRDFLASDPSPKALNDLLQRQYRVYRSTGNGGDRHVLFTGYYEPFLNGSLERTDVYRYPIYALPEDLVQIDLSLFDPLFEGRRIVVRIEDQRALPYYDREAIAFEGRIAGKAEVLAWVDDRIDLFFLHIQGSGAVRLDTGGTLRVHYRASNGQPYRSIGRLLIDEGRIEKSRMSMQQIRRYLAAHPEEMRRILTHNPSYVFFEIEEEGPRGALGVRLTPGRSLAVDRRLFPDAALAFVETRKPLVGSTGRIVGWTGLNRFMLNQDTGGAIRGAHRADIFWGSGAYAETAAGHLQHPGRLFFFVLAPESAPESIPPAG